MTKARKSTSANMPTRITLGRPPVGIVAGIALAAVALIPLAALMAQPAAAPFTVVETNRGYASLQEAVDAIGSGEGSIAIAPGTYRQCVVQTRGRIAFLATEPGKVEFTGTACEGKGAFVLRGTEASVSGIIFSNISVPDGNGAGIRMESGTLTVANSWFRNSEQGILTANDPMMRLVVDRSTFTRLGTCENSGGCSHSIYTGDIGHLRVTRSRFEQGTGGHYWFVQGEDKENYSAFIAVGAEEQTHSSDGLTIAGNDARFVPSLSRQSAFVADWTGASLRISDNRLGNGLTPFERR